MDTITQEHPIRTTESFATRVTPFRPRAPWVGGDLQSIRNFLRRPTFHLDADRSERIHLPLDRRSGDRASAMLHWPKTGIGQRRPAVMLIHGLTGCENSVYMRASTAHLLRAGFPVLRLNL